MNINEGRNYYPSSMTENLVEKLAINRHNPGTLQTQQSTAYVIGENKVSALNQAVQGGVNIMNLQVNGPVRVKDPVPQTNRVLTKFENKRRSTENQEALYNIRQADDHFVYGNYLNQQLADKAKQKVFNKPSITFREQIKDVQTFGEFKANALAESVGMNTFDLDFKDADDSGVLRFNQDNIGALGISNTTAASMSPGYNPMLLTSNQNKYDQRYGPALPDERMTFYTGERPYITKGERQLQARELATSEYVKEKIALQQMANDAANRTPHNPRAGVAEFKRGLLNVQPITTETFGNKFDRESVNENFVDRVNLTTDGGLERMRDIQQAIELEESPVIAEIKSKEFDKNVIRKIHTDNGDHKLFGNDSRHVGASTGLGGLYETFKSFVSKDKLLNDVAVDELKSRKQREYKNEVIETGRVEKFDVNVGSTRELEDSRLNFQKEYTTSISKKIVDSIKSGLGLETFKEVEDSRLNIQKEYTQPSLSKKIINSIKSGLGLETPESINDVRYEGQLKTGYTEDVFDDYKLRERLKELEKRKNDFDINNGKYLIINNGKVKKYVDDVGFSDNVAEPMSLLTTENGVVIRSIVVKENDVCKIIQARQNGEFKDYSICVVPTEMLEGIFGHELRTTEDSRFVALNAHEHVAINIILEEMPEKMKFESSRPLNIYQRDILNSTIPKIGCITETKILQHLEAMERENLRIDGSLANRQIASTRSNNEQRVIQTQTLKENRQPNSRDHQKFSLVDPKKYTSRFNE